MNRADRRRHEALLRSGKIIDATDMAKVAEMQENKRLRATSIVPGRVEYTDNGPVTWLQGHKYPVHGIATDEGMWVGEIIKKYAVSWLKAFSKSPQRYFLILFSPLLLIFFSKILNDWLTEYGRFVDGVANKFARPDLFSPAVKHLYEVLCDVCIPGNISADERSWILHKIFIPTIALEQDKHYRLVFQDLMMAARKDQLILHPAREAARLVDLMLKRDQRAGYKNLGWAVKLLLWTQPEIRRFIREFAERADLSKFYFDNIDLWLAFQQNVIGQYGYAFGDKSLEEMERDYAIMNK